MAMPLVAAYVLNHFLAARLTCCNLETQHGVKSRHPQSADIVVRCPRYVVENTALRGITIRFYLSWGNVDAEIVKPFIMGDRCLRLLTSLHLECSEVLCCTELLCNTWQSPRVLLWHLKRQLALLTSRSTKGPTASLHEPGQRALSSSGGWNPKFDDRPHLAAFCTGGPG